MEDEQEFSRALVGVREEWLALREDLTLAGQREVRTLACLVCLVCLQGMLQFCCCCSGLNACIGSPQGAAVAWFVQKLQRARLGTAWSDWLAGLDAHASYKCELVALFPPPLPPRPICLTATEPPGVPLQSDTGAQRQAQLGFRGALPHTRCAPPGARDRAGASRIECR